MRELKFRAWIIDAGIMIYSDTREEDYEFAVHNGVLGVDEYMPTGTKRYEVVVYEWDAVECIIMQSTGMKDINGKEIYEGDIVKITGENEEHIGIGNIVYYNSMYYVDGDICDALNEYDTHGYIELIGNINENPELLEGGEYV